MADRVPWNVPPLEWMRPICGVRRSVEFYDTVELRAREPVVDDVDEGICQVYASLDRMGKCYPYAKEKGEKRPENGILELE